jgi:beta-lactamase superfamily II metal-dependent hydrolase
VGGAELAARLFSAQQICASPVHFRSPAYRRIMADLSRMPGKLRTISRNDRVGEWTVLHPEPGDHFPKADDNTLVLFEEFQGTRVLLLSDLGPLGQEALMQRTPDLRADIVVAGLPATGEALGDALLDAVRPSVIIVSDSSFPVAKRASPKFRERLARRQIPVIYIRSAGTATIELRKDQWEIRTMSGIKLKSQDQKTENP